MKKLLILCAALFIAFAGQAQEKPFRIGIKFGVPNIVGLNAEYVTPILGGKLAPTADFSYFSLSAAGAKVSFSYLEIGSNYYFMNQGKGLYGHVSYGNIGFKGTYDDPQYGDGEGKATVSLVNLKLGAKLGNTVYFRPELGYAVGSGGKVRVEYDGYSEEEDIPGFLSGGLVVNLGFGFAF